MLTRCTIGLIGALLLSAPAWAGAAQTQPDPGLAALQALERRLESAIQTAMPSVVTIGRRVVPGRINTPGAGVDASWFVTQPVGTGVAVKAGGLILTNYHLVVPSTEGVRWELYVWLPGGRRVPAQIVAADPRSDLAVVKVDAPGLKPLPTAARNLLRRGRIVLVLSRPTGERGEEPGAATWAMIGNVAPRIDADARRTIHTDGTLVQIDARMPEVGSGAAVVDLEGRLVAVTTSMEAIAGFRERGTFAIPVFNRFGWVVEKLSAGLPVEYGFLGVTRNAPIHIGGADGHEPAEEGVRISDVLPASPASWAGLKSGDRIVRIDETPIREFADMTRLVGLMPTGRKCEVHYRRGDHRLRTTVTLGKYPVQGRVIASAGPKPWRGMRIDWATVLMQSDEVVDRLGRLESRRPAVIVVECLEGSPAGKAGIQPGRIVFKINGTPVASPSECYRLLRAAKGNVKIETDEDTVAVPER